MRISYHEDTDSLYIHLNETPTLESEEVAPGTVLHFDEDENVTGFEIYFDASKRVDLSEVEIIGLDDVQASTVRATDPANHLVGDHPWPRSAHPSRTRGRRILRRSARRRGAILARKGA